MTELIDLLSAGPHLIPIWFHHTFAPKAVESDDVEKCITFITLANSFIESLPELDKSCLPNDSLALSPYLKETEKNQVYRVKFRSDIESPPNCILSWYEWSAIWHALHPLYRPCSPIRYFDMKTQGNTLLSIYRAVNTFNDKKDATDCPKGVTISRNSTCLIIMDLKDENSMMKFRIALLMPVTCFAEIVRGTVPKQVVSARMVTVFYQFKEGHTFTSQWTHSSGEDCFSFLPDSFDQKQKALCIGDAIVVPNEFGQFGVIMSQEETVFGDFSKPKDLNLDYPTVNGQFRKSSVSTESSNKYDVLGFEVWTI